MKTLTLMALFGTMLSLQAQADVIVCQGTSADSSLTLTDVSMDGQPKVWVRYEYAIRMNIADGIGGPSDAKSVREVLRKGDVSITGAFDSTVKVGIETGRFATTAQVRAFNRVTSRNLGDTFVCKYKESSRYRTSAGGLFVYENRTIRSW